MADPVIILLNGPPRVGKDTIGAALSGLFSQDFHVVQRKISKILKEETHRHYHLVWEDGTPYTFNHYEDMKDTPLPEFDGRTPREAYIHLSEDIMKPSRGKDIFGRLILKELQQDEQDARTKGKRLMVILTDSGFMDEILPISDYFGAKNLLLFQLYRIGTGFAGDSRSYLDPKTIVRDNTGPVFDSMKFRNDGLVADVTMHIGRQILGHIGA